MGHAQFHKGRMKGDDPEIDTAQTPKRFDGCLALQEKIRKTFTDSILNNLVKPGIYNAVAVLIAKFCFPSTALLVK